MRVIAFGEVLLRLTPPGFTRIVQAETFEVTYGGAEANVCAFLAQMGIPASLVTRLPLNPLGDAALWHLRRFGVGTEYIVRGGERIGMYFFERGVSQRPGRVIYDRKHSSFACAKRGEFSWESILEGASWLHSSGITPALGGELPGVLEEAFRTARKLGVTVSFDLNYRETLWGPETARATLSPLMPYVDVFVGNEHQVREVFGFSCNGERREYLPRLARELHERFGVKTVALTFREGSLAHLSRIGAMLSSGETTWFSRMYEVAVVESIGAGDCFTGGLIFGMLRGFPPGECLEFAVAAYCLKHTVPGDFGVLSFEEIQHLALGMFSPVTRR
ncbi:PfkB family carbohydrate kinase [Candidatus Caldatribacterium saccharofermentans]|uniref:Sugar kinase n=1 Tax=Candidatus Caldatribacterium saccharofermentans TaxID=1454753 RepID=A0A7V4WJU1_9BACT